jgi:hypothetical protein
MQTIRLDIDALEVRSFATTKHEANGAPDPADRSAVSATNGVVLCKSCGPCCQ